MRRRKVRGPRGSRTVAFWPDRTPYRGRYSTPGPLSGGARKLRGEPGLSRLPLSGWRVVYTVEADRLLVLVLLIGGRGDVYERLKRRLG